MGKLRPISDGIKEADSISDVAPLECNHHSVGAVIRIQLRENVLEVVFDRMFRDLKL